MEGSHLNKLHLLSYDINAKGGQNDTQASHHPNQTVCRDPSGLASKVQKFPDGPLFNSFSKYLLGTHYVQGTALGSEDTEMKRDNKTALLEPMIYVQIAIKQLNSEISH